MTDANEAVKPPSSCTMPGTFSTASTQRSRPTVAPRRTSSAPDLRSPSSFGSVSPGSSARTFTGQGSTESSPYSRSSYSHHEFRPHEHHLPLPHITPLTPSHDTVGSRRSTFDPTTTTGTGPGPPPANTIEEEVSVNVEVMARRLEEIRRTLSRRNRRGRLTLRGSWVVIRGVFGYGPEGTAARRESVSLAGKLAFGTGQIAATIALLSIGAHVTSPTDSPLTEWQACQRPLGAWCSIWCVRVVLGCLMAVWGYRRKAARLAEVAGRVDPLEPNSATSAHAEAPATVGTRNGLTRFTQVRPNPQVSEAVFSRLTTVLSLLSLVWFITAHILAYTSIHTCRLSSPHLWWLTFGIICIGYLVIVEVIVVAFLVFILGPLIFVGLNIVLICMGRHPLRHPAYISPEVGKLPVRAVDQIPLVLYIPAPKETPGSQNLSQRPSSLSTPRLTVPEPAHIHSYPPEPERVPVSHTSGSGTRVHSRSRRLFTFRRIRLKKKRTLDDDNGKEQQLKPSNGEEGSRYEDKWEKGEYPFVKLEDNRAACAICLCDFDEPRRVRYSFDSKPPEALDQVEKGLGDEGIHAETEGELRLTDAGEGAQPLRLLDCAHVFHKTCLDPWLTEVSGRCPVCQKPVEVKEAPKNRRTYWWGRRRG
ncbi:hypothetical protein JB92DRAFT_3007265 [Gautieria morchelliformis]|nr:hypothetical protein JB92DRAFT_3007265 [Gautieria morchelliformis]